MKRYSINELATMTGLTTRTLRNYISDGFLIGNKKDGVWEFSLKDVEAFINNPAVNKSIVAKNNAVVYDFLADNKKKHSSICTILDLKVQDEEAGQIMTFFCAAANETEPGVILKCERKGSNLRVILSGEEECVKNILGKFYSR